MFVETVEAVSEKVGSYKSQQKSEGLFSQFVNIQEPLSHFA